MERIVRETKKVTQSFDLRNSVHRKAIYLKLKKKKKEAFSLTCESYIKLKY